MAKDIAEAGGVVATTDLDALDERAVNDHAQHPITAHTRTKFPTAKAGASVVTMVAERAASGTLLGRFPTLAQVADYAAFVASARAGAMTGAISNLSCGSVVD